MARLNVYRLANSLADYVVDVLSDFVDHLASRTVVPLVSGRYLEVPIRDLNPVFNINGTPQARSLPHLEHDAITRALDILLTGF